MALERIGMSLKSLKDFYVANKPFNAAVNTIGLYGLVKGAGAIFPAVDSVTDVLAPVVSGSYALVEVNQDDKIVKNALVKDLATVTIAAFMGLDLADTLVNYAGGAHLMDQIKDSYSEVSQKLAVNPKVLGFISGGISGAIGKIRQGYKNSK